MDKHFSLKWSQEDQEYVGLCDELPLLSWLDCDPVRAIQGIIRLVEEINEQVKE